MSVASVLERYSDGAKAVQADLCCPVDYDPSLLKLLPDEIIERDYGCGDPSRYVRPGDTVLDLGSGGGKICYMAAQLVGENGRVIGVDMNDDMLELARRYQGEMAERIGGDRVEFLRGEIQNLQGLVESDSVDLVVSNCVLNLVDREHRQQMIDEIHRVLRPGGRVAISDIVSDVVVPEKLQQDAELWSGCISGAFQELEFLQAFSDIGFGAVAYDKWDEQPWRVVGGIEFRSVTLTAVKGEGKDCIDRGHAVIYKGPYKSAWDDEGHEFRRGERMAVCERTFRFLTTGPMREDFIAITPETLWEPREWCAAPGTVRSPDETRGGHHGSSNAGSGCC